MGFLARLSLRMITILVMLSLILIHSVGGSRVHHILPESATHDQCPTGESCLNLATLTANTNNFLDSNIILILLAGNHTLDTELTVSNTLQLSVNGSFTANIVCRGNGSLEFINITQIEIIALNLTGCSSKVSFVDQFTLKDSTFLGSNDSSSSALLLHHVSDTKIIGSSFTSNTMGHYRNQVEYLRSFDSMVWWANIRSYNARVGGALIVTSSTVNISRSHFDSNSAQVGGAIVFEESCNVTISNCTFVNNSATGCNCELYSCDDRCHGGAMFIGRRCTVTAHNSSFVNNTAGSFGGAVALFQATFFDSQNMFYRNNATAGGVISVYNGCRIILDCSYYNNNIAYHRKRSNRQQGGVMYVHSSNIVTVKKSSFDNNESGRYGGVMYAYYSSITVGNSSFTNNEAGDSGGVVYAVESSNITVDSTSFTNNKAISYGGVLHAWKSSSITVGNSSFNDNEANYNGGVMYASGSSITVGYSSFDNNVAGNDGGVMYAYSSSSIIVCKSSFDNNEAGSSGGVMEAFLRTSITLDNSSFDNNEAPYGGVMSACSNSRITVANSSFDNNKAGYDGGVMFAEDSSNITVDNSSFDSNKASRDGGVMYALDNSSITVNKCSFGNNQAYSGGVMYTTDIRPSDDYYYYHYYYWRTIRTTDASVNSCSFLNNSASKGGVIYIRKTPFMDQGSVYSNNMATSNGGVITLNESNVTITASSFVNNTARNSGGVLYNTPGPSYYHENFTILKKCNFYNNQASSGGAIAFFANSLTVSESNFTHNKAIRGGAIYLWTGISLTVNCSNFLCNFASSDGGAIYSDSMTSSSGAIAFFANSLTVTESEFTHNKAIRGGAIYLWTGISLTVNCSNFLRNVANSDGGAIYSDSNNNLTINSSRLNNNRAEDHGGVVYLSFLSHLVIDGDSSNFFGNQAHRGGVVYARQSKIDIYAENSVMMGNSATETGGAIHLSAANLTLFNRNNTFVQNEAHIGGVIYASFSRVAVHGQRLLIANNTAVDAGGAVCGYSTVIGNKATSGGAVHLTKSQLFFSGSYSMIVGNQAESGGAVYASESKLLIDNDTQTYININTANHNGGGLYLTMSDLEVTGYNTYITGNRATNKGGGIHAMVEPYVKTWLQLAFPTYIIILANTVIIICSVCGRLAVSKDPVATLATVILFSYSKLLQIIIITFSSATLIYPDGLRKYVWLPDATVTFFTSKHAALFFIATLILLAGLVYTFLFLTWQWFLRCPEGRLKWIGGQKLGLFLETYHTPYVPKHRYWTGLLLLVRVSVYLMSAFNPSGDPRVVLLFSVFAISSLFLYIAIFGVKIYKLWLINAMEMFTYFNIIFVCAFTWYTLDIGVNQAPVINTSVAIIIVQISVILFYHIFKYTNTKLFTKIQEATCSKVYNKFVTSKKHAQEQCNNNEVELETQPEPVESIYCEVETSLKEQTPSPPPRAMKSEPDSQEQTDEQEGSYYKALVDENKQCPNVYSGIEFAIYDDIATLNEARMETQCSSTIEEEIYCN